MYQVIINRERTSSSSDWGYRVGDVSLHRRAAPNDPEVSISITSWTLTDDGTAWKATVTATAITWRTQARNQLQIWATESQPFRIFAVSLLPTA